ARDAWRGPPDQGGDQPRHRRQEGARALSGGGGAGAGRHAGAHRGADRPLHRRALFLGWPRTGAEPRACALRGAAMIGWWFAPAPPERLATLRIAIGLFATLYVLVRLPHFASFAALSPEAFRPVGPCVVLAAPLPPFAT